FKMLDEDLQRGLQEELLGAPGIPTAVMDYGEAREAVLTAGEAIVIPRESLAAKQPLIVHASPAAQTEVLAAQARLASRMLEPLPVPPPPPAAAAPGLMVAKPRAKRGPQTIPLPAPETARVAAAPPATLLDAPAAPVIETRSDGDFVTVTM